MRSARWKLGAAAFLALLGIGSAQAMPHDVAEARGCKPRIEGSASWTYTVGAYPCPKP
jgi:hypothetical protein